MNKLHKSGIIAVGIVIVILTIFFQINRLDILPRLFSSENVQHELSETVQYTVGDDAFAAMRECFLVLYDPTSVYSTYGKLEMDKYLPKLKRRTEARYYEEKIEYSDYKAVILTVDELSLVSDAVLKRLSQYVKDGGSVYLTGGMSPHWFLKQAGGIAESSQMLDDSGIRLYHNPLIGAGDFVCNSEVFNSYFLPCTLTDDATVYVKTYSKEKPLLWERKFGKGKFVVFNSVTALTKDWRGIFIAGLSRLYDDFAYPVINAKLMFIDDFPAPIPAGRLDAIYNEYKMDTNDFYRYVWWPDMLSFAAAHNVKYTGLVIQTYNDTVKAPFVADAGDDARKNLVAYGRELLKSGGEIGIHGYNHQSLAMEGYNQDELGYNVWQSPDDMQQAMETLKGYIEAVYPNYVIRSYVPPSNILSPEGRAAIRRAFPTVNIFCSLYTGLSEERCLYQDFSRNADGSYDIPRVCAGFSVAGDGYLSHFSVINAYGVFSHFVHPDELYYEESEGETWGMLRKAFSKFTKDFNDTYPWLRAATASEAAAYMDTYYDFDYAANYLENGDLEFWTNGIANAYLLFRTTKQIDSVEGFVLRNLGHGAYLLQTQNVNRCLISFKKQQDKNS